MAGKIIFITDIHQNIDMIRKLNFKEYDLVLCGGDIVDPTSPNINIAKSIIDLLPNKTYIIPGNCDKDELVVKYMKKKLNYLHQKKASLSDIVLYGVGYCNSLIEDIKTYREFFLEDRDRIFYFNKNSKIAFLLKSCGIYINKNEIEIISLEDALKQAYDFINKFRYFDNDELSKYLSNLKKDENSIFLTHSPPYGFLDKLDGLPHIGSKLIKNGIDKIKPKLVLCGHFHELSGVIKHGYTTYFNPGAAKDNRFGEIYYQDKNFFVESKSI